MKRLAMVAASAFLAMFLIGCGEGSKPAAPQTTGGATEQTQDNNAAPQNAAPQTQDNNAGGEQKPAEGQN